MKFIALGYTVAVSTEPQPHLRAVPAVDAIKSKVPPQIKNNVADMTALPWTWRFPPGQDNPFIGARVLNGKVL